MTTRFEFRSALVAMTASVVLAACGGGGSSASAPDTASPTSGTVRVALTDAPCDFDQVNITVDRVRMHTSAGANDNDAGWSEIVLNPARKINLLSLQNGVMADLGQATLPAGTYTQIRLVLAGNGAGSPANSVRPSGGSETPMDTPSGMQSGLKLISPFTVQPGQLTDIVLDFDACKSVVARGNGSFSLKPVMTMIPRTLTAITGYVDLTGMTATSVTVSAQKNGTVYRATQPNANGQFILSPVDPAFAPYDIVVTAPAKTTAVVTGVPVTKDQTTIINATGNAITLPTSATSTATGKVLPNGTWNTGAVRGLQKTTAADTSKVEVGQVNVNPADGTYTLTLPTAAPRVVAYVNPAPTPLGFAPYSASAGKYFLEAAATGYAPKQGNEVLLPQTGQDFTLSAAP